MRTAVSLAALTLATLASACLTGPTAGGGSKSASSGKTSGEPGTLFHDFEGDSVKGGGVWAAGSDTLNMGTKANFELKDGGADGSGKAGHFSGFLPKGAAPNWPWVSLGVGFNPGNSPTDVSAVKAIRFMTKGDGRKYRLRLTRAAVTDYAHFGAEFEAGKDWKQVEIPLSKMTQQSWGKQIPVEWKDVKQLEIVPVTEGADYDIYIDNIELVLDPSKPSPFQIKEEPTINVDGTALLVDDFDGKGPRNGSVWGAEFDMNNLGTIATYRAVATDDPERKTAGQLKGKLGKNVAPWPWATLAINVEPNAKPTDLSAVRAIRFWAKGNGEQVNLQLARKSITDYGHPRRPFTVPVGKWRQITIPLEQLVQPDWAVKVPPGWSDVVSIQFSPANGEFDFMIDNVELVLDPAKPAPFKAQ